MTINFLTTTFAIVWMSKNDLAHTLRLVGVLKKKNRFT